MKPVLFVILLALISCTAEKEIQASMVDATLVKITSVNRYPNKAEKILTWRTSNNITYVTFAPATTDLAVGTKRLVLVKR